MMVMAESVSDGHFVLYRKMIGLKAVRHGKDHVNHYFLPLELSPEKQMTVTYLDFTEKVQDCHESFSLNLEPLTIYTPVAVGDVLVNMTGTYIKACEKTKGIISFVYINLKSGELRRRQERQISAVYRWTLTCIGVDPRQESESLPHLIHDDDEKRNSHV